MTKAAAIQEQPHSLDNLVAEQRERLRELITMIAEGVDFDPQEIIDLAVVNGMSLARVQQITESAGRLRDLQMAYEAENFAEKIETAKEAVVTAREAKAVAQAKFDAATKALNQAREHEASVSGTFQAIQRRKEEAEKQLHDALRKGVEPDARGALLYDWSRFRMD